MKAILLLAACILIASTNAGKIPEHLVSDFIQGFEQGIFIRETPELAQREHNCAEPDEAKKLNLKAVNTILEPLKAMMQMSKDKEKVKMIKSAQVFVEKSQDLLNILEGYDAGDFCKGLYFGITGATLLTQIAETISDFAQVF